MVQRVVVSQGEVRPGMIGTLYRVERDHDDHEHVEVPSGHVTCIPWARIPARQADQRLSNKVER